MTRGSQCIVGPCTPYIEASPVIVRYIIYIVYFAIFLKTANIVT